MRGAKAIVALMVAGILACGTAASQSLAVTPAPAWSIQSLAGPTNFSPGAEDGLNTYEIFVANSGGEVSDGSAISITDTLPPGLGVESVMLEVRRAQGVDLAPAACQTEVAGEVSTVTCEVTESLLPAAEPAKLYPGEALRLLIRLDVPASASGTLTNRVSVEGGGAQLPVLIEADNAAATEPAPSGFQEFHTALTQADGSQARSAASRPYQYSTSFAINTELAPPQAKFLLRPAGGDLKEIDVALPPGLVGNPNAIPRCTARQFNTVVGIPGPFGTVSVNDCPDGSAVGVVAVRQLEGSGQLSLAPIYNLVPPRGMPAQLGFQILELPIYINTRLRSDGDYGIDAYLDNSPEAKRVTAAVVTIWGVPAEGSHDPLRGGCVNFGGSCPAGLPAEAPFMRLPSSCQSPLLTTMTFDTWLNPGALVQATSEQPPPVECEAPDFSPRIEARPTTNVADAPSGLRFNLHLPQKENEDPEGLGEADLRRTEVTLPPGLVVNPASANGLAACSLSEIGFEGVREGRNAFSATPAACPDASKIGTVEVRTPLVDHPLPGAVYLARQGDNPFGSLLAIYIAVADPLSGVVVKLAAEVEPDPVTGQLKTTVEESPQLPFEDFELEFFAGARAALRTPASCGTHATTTALRPWTAPAGPTATPSDSFETTTGAGGGACPGAPPHAPAFSAGTADPLAGAYSPFLLNLKREDGSQEIAGLQLSLPQGLTGKLAGIGECPAATLAAAALRSGREEQAAPSCPSGSEVGQVVVGAGAGPAPLYVRGRAYLAGPYKGAPLSMAIVTPAVAGPFDLGTVVVRAALRVDPETARITAVSDPIPTILQGIPLDVRSISLRLDRSRFTLNPTSCEAMSIGGAAISASGQSAPLSNRFQVGGCRELGFRPKLSLRLRGGTKRNQNPALRAVLTYPEGAYANIASAQVALPHSQFLDQFHIRTICTRVQFAADACPPGSIYGRARAETPLLASPLEGPVYLRSSNNKLPDLVADLRGQLQIVLAGRTDSFREGLRTTFGLVPDAPVTRFMLELRGGKRGLIVNSTNVCRGTHRATARFTAHNGRALVLRPQLKAKCGGQKGKRAGRRAR